MGATILPMIGSTQYQPAPIQMATANTERRTRLRSSSRCSIRLMEPILRSSFSTWAFSGSATRSGIVVPWDGIFHAFTQAVQGALNEEVFIGGDFGDLRLKVFARIRFFQFELADLFLKLALEMIAGPFEFGHEFAHLPGNPRQALGPKKQHGQHQQEKHF